uniref:RNA_pol_Rbc25 domain-containing protein n=1 Tax=Panagrellus redivivus TaxID=6233 RepID=A0A7E4ZRY8_PANRE
MFVTAELEHTVQIEPDELDVKFEDCIVEKLNAMLSGKIIKDVGLCITFFSFTKISPSYIPQGAATIFVPVSFRYLVFVLTQGEVLDCYILKGTPEGIYCTTRFFEDIFVPRANMPEGSLFDENTQTWNWHYKNEENEMVFAMDTDLEARVLIESTTYKDVKVGKHGSPMVVTASMNAPGLGCLSWWQSDETEEEA